MDEKEITFLFLLIVLEYCIYIDFFYTNEIPILKNKCTFYIMPFFICVTFFVIYPSTSF